MLGVEAKVVESLELFAESEGTESVDALPYGCIGWEWSGGCRGVG